MGTGCDGENAQGSSASKILVCEKFTSSFDSAKDILEDKFVEMSSYRKELMFSLDRHPSFANDSFWVSELYKKKECVCVCLRTGDGGISWNLT